MRGLIQLVVVLSIVFFVVGEFAGGWYVGMPATTPVFLYKKTADTTLSRRTTSAQDFTFAVSGTLRAGSLVVEGSFERPGSYQNPGQQTIAERPVFRQEFRAGQRIALQETLKQGQGVYRVKLIFDKATGNLSVTLPEAGTL